MSITVTLVVATALVGLAAVSLVRRRLGRLHATTNDNQEPLWLLQQSPNTLKGVDLWCLTLSILAKYVPGSRGYHNRPRPATSGQQFALPLIHVKGVLQFDDRDAKLFTYALQVDKQTPAGADVSSATMGTTTNDLFLVALTTPLLVYILAQHDCPVRPLGAVNVRNTFHFLDAAACRDVLGLRDAARAGHLTFSALFGGAQRPGFRRKRGMEFEITINVYRQGKAILVQHLFFLQFLPKTAMPKFEVPSSDDDIVDPPSASTSTTDLPLLTTLSPRIWAASCGDYNPIHISPFAARLFGFPSVIAHGNYIVALALESLRTADDGQALEHDQSYVLDVKFVRPFSLPARPTLKWGASAQTSRIRFDLLRGDKECITGTIDDRA